MMRNMLQAKLHHAADIKEHQAIDIYNINNGERFSSYAVAAERGSGTIAVLGAAARRVAIGDLLIICTYSQYTEDEVAKHEPHLIYVDDANKITHSHNQNT